MNEKVIKKLEKINKEYGKDAETAHSEADRVLCDFLMELGYADVVAAYEKIQKYYC